MSKHTHPRLLAAATAPDWAAQLWRRLQFRWWLKTLGISLFIWLFFIAYFHLLNHPSATAWVMPLTPLDHAIPFQPGLLAVYVSLWVYVGIAPGLLPRLRDLLAYGLWATLLCLIGLACFYFFPTAIPLRPLPIDLAAHPAFALLQGVDAAGNACPSLHVATALFTMLWLRQLHSETGAPRWLAWVNGVWFSAIVYSTLAIRQHVVLDVLAGALLGLAVAWLSLRWRPAPSLPSPRDSRPVAVA